MDLYDVSGLAFAYAGRTVRFPDFRVPAGAVLGLTGDNGTGKSTLLRLLAFLRAPAAGAIRFGGQPADTEARRQTLRRSVCLLLQESWLLSADVSANVAYGLKVRGIADPGRVAGALDMVGLDPARFGRRDHRELSGGEARRVALAARLAIRPQALLLDEPTASLDPHAKRDVEALIADFGAEAPAPGRLPPTLVFASHNLGQVKRLATRVVYMEQGCVLADLPVHDFFNQSLLEAHFPQASAFVKGETT